jgi:hypothetical protein
MLMQKHSLVVFAKKVLLVVLLLVCWILFVAAALLFAILLIGDSRPVHGVVITSGYLLLVTALILQSLVLRYIRVGFTLIHIAILSFTPVVSVGAFSSYCIINRALTVAIPDSRDSDSDSRRSSGRDLLDWLD